MLTGTSVSLKRDRDSIPSQTQDFGNLLQLKKKFHIHIAWAITDQGVALYHGRFENTIEGHDVAPAVWMFC